MSLLYEIIKFLLTIMPALIDSIKNIASELANPNLNFSVAEALRWNTGFASISHNEAYLNSTIINKGFIGPQPAAIFSHNINGNNSINDSALYAYHASIPWGVVVSTDNIVIFNSHWIRQNDWFHLPAISWDEIEQNRDIFDALTPEGIEEGRIDKIASKIYKPDRFLRPVDDALVERLDYWRSETLRYSREVKNVDEALQTLFAQLFILRTVEDRNLAFELSTLRSVCSISGEVNIAELRKVLLQAQKTIGGELYEIDTLEYIPENILGGIINDLYTPYNLPGNSRYNFSWIDADILGLVL